MRRWAWIVVAAVAALGCRPAGPPPLVERAEFGVYFGSQVQQRREIPLVFDRAKQNQGFRLQFSHPLDGPLTVRWEVDMPGTARRVRDVEGRPGLGRLVKLGQGEARVGLTRFDQELRFVPGDSVGTWNIRVIAGDDVVIDRPFAVYDPGVRRRAEKEQREQARAAILKAEAP